MGVRGDVVTSNMMDCNMDQRSIMKRLSWVRTVLADNLYATTWRSMDVPMCVVPKEDRILKHILPAGRLAVDLV